MWHCTLAAAGHRNAVSGLSAAIYLQCMHFGIRCVSGGHKPCDSKSLTCLPPLVALDRTKVQLASIIGPSVRLPHMVLDRALWVHGYRKSRAVPPPGKLKGLTSTLKCRVPLGPARNASEDCLRTMCSTLDSREAITECHLAVCDSVGKDCTSAFLPPAKGYTLATFAEGTDWVCGLKGKHSSKAGPLELWGWGLPLRSIDAHR